MSEVTSKKLLAEGKPEGEMQIVEKIAIPCHTLHLDHFGPLERTADRFKYILAVVDAFTKITWLFATKSTTTDRGTAFTSNNFSSFLNDKKITHVLTAVASPWANGQVERVNRFLKSTLSKLTENPFKWTNVLGKVQFVLNNTFHRAINTTPSKLLLGYDQRQNSDKELCTLIEQLTEIDTNLEEERTKLRDPAQIENRAIQEYNKLKYDKRHRKPSQYKEGDLVLVRILQHSPGTNQKLLPKYKGPYQIKAVSKKNRFVVTDVPGFSLTQKPLNTIFSSDKLKPWIRISDE